MNILSFLSGILLTLSSIIGIHKEMPKATVLSIETTVAPTEIPTPLPTETPEPTGIPTVKIYPTKVIAPRPNEDLQKKVDELSKRVEDMGKSLTPTPRGKYQCYIYNDDGTAKGIIYSQEPCK